MGHGVHCVFTKTLVGGASQTTLPFDVGRSYQQMTLQISTMASAANVYLDVSADGGTSYYQLRHPPSAAGANPTFAVAATATANGGAVPLPAGFQHFRLLVDSAPTAAVVFKVICAD